jgi:hypothetical protein
VYSEAVQVDQSFIALMFNQYLQVFNITREKLPLLPLDIPATETVRSILERVLRLPSVASKRYLTNKVRLHQNVLLDIANSVVIFVPASTFIVVITWKHYIVEIMKVDFNCFKG